MGVTNNIERQDPYQILYASTRTKLLRTEDHKAMINSMIIGA